MTRLLASVRSPAEALTALDGGADIIDLKEPAAGALGRLADDVIHDILGAVAGRRPVSATVGDLPLAPQPVRDAVAAMAATGVDIVKLGIFPGDAASTLAALAPLARKTRLVAVCFGDRPPLDLDILPRAGDAGFYGVMLDTAGKQGGPLTRHLPLPALADFLDRARRRGLLAGLAGSLGVGDLPLLLPLRPDFLGFRSALTAGGRTAPLDAAAVARLRRAVARSSATAAAGA
jgi:dihydroneopterin aldolase